MSQRNTDIAQLRNATSLKSSYDYWIFRILRLFPRRKCLLSVLPVMPDVLDIVVILKHIEHLLHVLDIVLIGQLDIAVLGDHFDLCGKELVALGSQHFGEVAALIAASVLVVVIRLLAAHFRWNLPRLKIRSQEATEE